MKAITRQQKEALRAVYLRTVPTGDEASMRGYRAFRRTASVSHMDGCIMVPFCNMWLGIEEDGYTHS
jgi:hypothetical protein